MTALGSTTSPDRGSVGRLKRLPELDLESYHDFLTGMRSWMFRSLSAASGARAAALVESQRHREGGNALSFGEARTLFERDQTLALSNRLWISAQLMAHNSLLDGFRRHGDALLDRYEAAEGAGPGSLELNDDLDLPEYTRHEIHIQPGGYVGEAFAGPVYHYGTNSFYLGDNDQDEVYFARAVQLALPADGSLRRVLDIGCCVGQYPVAIKETYPDVEVWGIDVGAPLLRYAHMRATELGVDVHFAQRLAERSGFPDDHFDVVSAHILFHEVSTPAAEDIIREAWRVLRPGGVFDIVDFRQGMDYPPYTKYRLWVDHHYNGERWTLDYYARDMIAMLEAQGFEVTQGDAAKAQGHLRKYTARKPG